MVKFGEDEIDAVRWQLVHHFDAVAMKYLVDWELLLDDVRVHGVTPLV
jgi:hypothetical protein